MCFKIPRGNFFPKRAKEDIFCIKRVFYSKLDDELISEHELFKYKLNTIYKEKSFKIISLKSYDLIYKGFHSFIAKPYVIPMHGYIYVLCVIPKGSLYWKNEREGEYVSNRIILKEIMHD